MKKIYFLLVLLMASGATSLAQVSGFNNKVINVSKNTSNVRLDSILPTTNATPKGIEFGVDSAGAGIIDGSGGALFELIKVDGGAGGNPPSKVVIAIKNRASLVFETTHHIKLFAVAKNGTNDTAISRVTININAAINPIFGNVLLNLDENRPAGTKARTAANQDFFQANDPDGPNSQLTYQIITSPSPNPFTLSVSNGQASFTANSSLNFEAKSSYVFSVQVTDIDGLKDTATVTINVNDVNEAPSIANTTVNFSILESRTESDGAIFTVNASDPDAGQTLTYSINSPQVGAGGLGSAFKISSSGAVTVQNTQDILYAGLTSLDKVIRITVKVTDNGNPPLFTEKQFNIAVQRDANLPANFTTSFNGVSMVNDCNKLIVQLNPNSVMQSENLTQMRNRCGFGTGSDIFYEIERIERPLDGSTWSSPTVVHPGPKAYDWNGSGFTAISTNTDDFGATPGKEFAYRFFYKVGSKRCQVRNLWGNFVRTGAYVGAPVAPTSVVSSLGQFCDKVELQWSNRAANADKVKVVRFVDDNGTLKERTVLSANLSPATNTYVDNLNAGDRGKLFRYNILATNSSTPQCIESDPAEATGFSRGLPVPPSNLTAQGQDQCAFVELNWVDRSTQTSPPDIYYIYKSVDGGASSLYDSVSVNFETYNDRNPNLGSLNAFRVAGKNNCGIGSFSTVGSATLDPVGPIVSNYSLLTELTGPTSAALKISFTPGDSSLRHVIYRNGAELVNLNPGVSEFLDTEARPCENSNYMTAAINACGLGAQRNQVARIDPPLNLEPITATDGKFPDRIELSWDDLGFENNYRILKDGQQIAQTAKDVTSYLDVNSLPGELHTFSVIAINDCRSSQQQSDLGFADPNGSISGHISTPGGQFVENVEVTVTPLIGNSIKFNGTPQDTGHSVDLRTGNNRYVEMLGNITTNGGITIEGWFNITTIGTTTKPLFTALGTDGVKIAATYNGSAMGLTTFACANTSCPVNINTSGGVLPNNTWFHLAVSIESNGTTKIYKDGQLLLNHTNGAMYTGTINKIELGARVTQNAYISGDVDEFRVWGVARNAAQIFETYDVELLGNDLNLLRYARFNQTLTGDPGKTPNNVTAGTPASFDLKNGASLSNPSPVSPVIGGGFVQVGSLGNLIGPGSMTLSMWVKSDPGDIKNAYLASGENSGPGVQFTIGKGAPNVANIANASTGVRLNGSTPLNGQQWNHVAYVYRRTTGVAEIWVNGVRENSGNIGLIDWTNWNLALGASEDGVFPFKGFIDDVALWKEAKDSTFMAKYYQKGLNGTEENLVGYWKFNEGKEDFAFDRTDNDLHGTLTNRGVLINWAVNDNAPAKNLAITDSLGNYLIQAINYGTNVNGNSFTVTPYKAERGILHTFNPNNRTRMLSFTETSHDGVDFTDQTVMPLSGFVRYNNSTCFVEYVEMMLNGQSVNPIAQTNSNGVWRMDAPLGIQKISPRKGTILPDTVTMFVERPVAGLAFIDYEGYSIQGTVSGRCGIQIGPSKIRVKSDNGCFDQTYDVNADGTYFIDSVPPIMIEVQVIPDDQLIVFDPETFFHQGDTTINFVYQTPLEAEVVVDTNAIIIDNCFNTIKILTQDIKYKADIKVFETYTGGMRCPVDSADLRIIDNIADESNPLDTSFSNNPQGVFKYESIAGQPNLGGTGATQYRKSLEVTVTDSAGRQVVADEFVLVQGRRQRASTFATTAPDLVFYVLRDPPGDASFSYIGKNTELCRTIGVAGAIGYKSEKQITIQKGINITAGWVAEANFEAKVKKGIGFEFEAGFSAGYEYEHCVTLAQNVATSSDELYVGKDMDLFLGGALNYTFSILDILTYDSTQCKVNLSTAVGQRPEGIQTFFQYTGKTIKENVIPNLKILRDIPGQSRDSVDFWQRQIDGWNIQLEYNEDLKRAARPFSYNMPIGGSTYNNNISFGYGSGYSSSRTVGESHTVNAGLNIGITKKVGLSFEADIAGIGIEGGIDISKSASLETSFTNVSSSSTEIGFELGDNDPGDLFSVNLKEDLVYGTIVFETVAGESMCPHEEKTVPREGVQVSARRTTVVGLQPDERAVFEIELTNLSQTEDGQDIDIRFTDGIASGAVMTLNGLNLAGGATYNVNGDLGDNTILLRVEVERAVDKFEHREMVLTASSHCDGGFEDNVVLNAIWERPCAEISLINPKEGWVVDANSNDQLSVSFTGYDTLNPSNMVDFILQYRRKNGAWIQVDDLKYNDLIGTGQFGNTPLFASMTWQISPTLPDGEYEVRVRTNCAINTSFSDVATGVISRRAPTVFGVPQPADGILDAGDEISVTFNENIDCSKLNVESITLKGVLSGFEYVSKALEFNGVDNYVEIPHIPAYNFGSNDDFSLEFWVRSGFNNNDPCLVSNKDWSNGRNKGFAVSVYQGNRFRFNLGDGVNMLNINGPVIADNQWHHIAVSVDRDFGVFVYKDGVQVARDTVQIKNIGNTDSGLPIVFAQDGTTNYPYHWAGQLDEVRLWNAYRFQLNVLQGRFRTYDFDEPNLIGSWRLDDGNGPFAFDRSTNANFGDLMNGPSWVLTNAAPISMDDVESLVDIDFTCSGPKIVIDPVLDIKYLENSFFTATVYDAKDFHNNQIVTPVIWDFFVDQNPVGWERTNVSYSKLKSENLVFTEKLINSGPYRENYVLENVPAWITPTPAQGQIPASFVESIVFTVDSFVNPGSYSQKINAATTKGWEPLFLDVNVLCPPPSWNVNAASYTSSMQVTGQLILDGDTAKSEHDMVAAFVGDEIRGVANIQKTVAGYFYFLDVYSNNPAAGETIIFKAWDAINCKEHHLLDQTLNFVEDTLIGGITNPFILQTTGVVVQEIALSEGWNWISLAVNPDTGLAPMPVNSVLATLSPQDSNVIMSQTQTSMFYTQVNQWDGNLQNMDNKSMYRVRVDNADVIRYAGHEVNPSALFLNIVQGWNHIGYPLGGNVSVEAAMSSLSSVLSTGDILKSQHGYAEFVAGLGWFGSLKFLEPGKGYMLKSSGAGILAYPSIKTNRNREIQNNELILMDKGYKEVVDAKNWKINAGDFPVVSTVTGKLFYSDHFEVRDERVLIVAKLNDEVRGITHGRMVNNQAYFFMTYYARNGETGKLTFEAYFESEDNTYPIIQTIELSDRIADIGSLNTPFSWYLDAARNQEEEVVVEKSYDGFYLGQNHPNPFLQGTAIEFAIPNDGEVNISIYNTHGQLIDVLTDREYEAGTYLIRWDGTDAGGRHVMPGVYFYTMISGDFYATKKAIHLSKTK